MFPTYPETEEVRQVRRDWQELVEAGLVARVSKDDSQWELGDLASEVQKDYGKDKLGEYAEDVNMEKQTMKVYRYVATSYEKVIRITFSQLSFLHFQVVAALDDRESWLQLALDNNWTVEKLREEIRKSVRVDSPPLPDKKYRTVVIDPPWEMKKMGRDVRPKQIKMDYPSLTFEEIRDFRTGNIAITDLMWEDGCHVYLWTTHKHLPDALALFHAWNVKYQCQMTWVKNVGITPFSWMYSTEHVLFGHKGNLKLLKEGVRLDFSAKVRGHSRKPDEFYEIVRKVSPETRIDVFSREKRDGFEQYGAETDKYGI